MQDCTDFIFTLRASQFKGEPLEAVKKLLVALGHPESKTKFIHFAGSNGKGSTLNATREILMQHGLTVGAFISPHLERANERITINKQHISDEDFVRIANKVAAAVVSELDELFPSFFEFVTVMMFVYFAEQQLDVALVETGIGGRLDTTNVLTPEVSVITTVSLEHTDMLGDTYEQVAREKAGIIKQGKPVVVGVRQQAACEVIRKTADAIHAPLYRFDEEIKIVKKPSTQLMDVKWQDEQLTDVWVKMAGDHQLDNAALAITASRLFDATITEQTIRQALAQASWDGRFEQLAPTIILDGAHNSEGTKALLETLAHVAPHKRYIFIYAALQDKDHGMSIRMMDEVASEMCFTEMDLPRKASAVQLAHESTHEKKCVQADWRKLIAEKMAQLADDELLIITGSLYFIAEARTYLQGVLA